MKKLVTSFLCSLILGSQVFAGNYVPETRLDNELSISYGRVTIPSFAFVVGGVLATAFSFGLAEMDDYSSTGGISVGYYNYLNNHIAIGCDASFECISLGMKGYSGKDESGKSMYENKMDPNRNVFLSVMPGVKLPWFNRKHFSMYSKLNAGAMLQHSPKYEEYKEGTDGQAVKEVTAAQTSVSFACQIDPIGMEFGNISFRGFLELGVGMEGLMKLGFRYAF